MTTDGSGGGGFLLRLLIGLDEAVIELLRLENFWRLRFLERRGWRLFGLHFERLLLRGSVLGQGDVYIWAVRVVFSLLHQFEELNDLLGKFFLHGFQSGIDRFRERMRLGKELHRLRLLPGLERHGVCCLGIGLRRLDLRKNGFNRLRRALKEMVDGIHFGSRAFQDKWLGVLGLLGLGLCGFRGGLGLLGYLWLLGLGLCGFRGRLGYLWLLGLGLCGFRGGLGLLGLDRCRFRGRLGLFGPFGLGLCGFRSRLGLFGLFGLDLFGFRGRLGLFGLDLCGFRSRLGFLGLGRCGFRGGLGLRGLYRPFFLGG